VSCPSSYCNCGDGGYGFTYSDSQNMPPLLPGPSTVALETNGTLCVSGNVGQVVGMDYADDWGAGFGCNLNQAQGASTPANPLTLTGAGIIVWTSAVPACTSARVVIDNGGVDYCAPLTSGVLMPWGSFNTTCWNNLGTFLTGAPTSTTVRVQLVSSATQSCPFTDFCITKLQL
jgi:hypothetical protein